MAEETYIEHPNRDKAGSKAAKAVIVLLMLVTAGLMLVTAVMALRISDADSTFRRAVPPTGEVAPEPTAA